MNPTYGIHPAPSFSTLAVRNSLQPWALPYWCLLALTSASERIFVFLLHLFWFFFFFFFLLPDNLLHDLGQSHSPKCVHLLTADENDLLTQGMYCETPGKVISKSLMLLNSILLHDQQFPRKRVKMLRFSEAKERDQQGKSRFQSQSSTVPPPQTILTFLHISATTDISRY